MNFLAPWEPQLRSVLRIVAGYTFSLHGYQKIFGWFGGMNGNSADLMSLMGAAGLLESIGGALIILGLFTRPTAFVLSGQMAAAYFMAHAPNGALVPLLNDGELAALYCFLFLWFASAGPGAWSIDALRSKS
jgi:putative oxidoreductase